MKPLAQTLKILMAGLLLSLHLPLCVSAEDTTPEQLYLSARQASQNADYTRALQAYRKLLEQYPDNPDYLLGIGQTLIWQGQPDEAIPHLQQGLRLAPDYEDIYTALFQALQAAGKPEEAETLRATAAGRFDTAVWTQPVAVTPTKAEKTGFNLLLANQLEFPAKGQPNWRESMAEFGAQTSNDNRYAIQIVQTERFDLSDMTVGVNGYYKLAKSTGIQLTAALSPDHRVMPEKRVQLQLSHTLSNGWGGIAGIGYTGYSESDVTSTDITIEKYIANYRLAYTLFRSDSNTVGAASSHRLQIGYYFPAASSLQLAYITGEEIEKLTDASTLLSSKVDTMAIWGELRLSPSVGLLYSAGKTWIKPFGLARTDREFIRIGLNYYF